jgi:aminopeptidase N
MRKFLLSALLFLQIGRLAAQQGTTGANAPRAVRFTHADTLRGAITPERAWWDVVFYDLHVRVQPADSSIQGYNRITYRVLDQSRDMQIDLMTPLEVDSMVQDGQSLAFRRDGNAFFVRMPASLPSGSLQVVTVYYHGRPRVATHPPWDGGFVWTTDSLGNPWIATACQGVGASIWWPNKDTQADEPDSQRIVVTVPDTLVDVSNGRLRRKTLHGNGTISFEWFVQNPINNYDVALNVGKYIHFTDTYTGVNGRLDLDYWVLPFHLNAAKRQFAQVKPMLKCFEYWFGPYPWYTDGYKLVETPYLGMEHQSGIGYGNEYGNGYLGRDLSGTGWGLKWDFILIHESAHEWFGNNITAKDIADMWIHEAFATYAESLYTECQFGKKAGVAYCIGERVGINGDRPVIGAYGVNDEGSQDMYNKGSNMLLTIRQIIDDDKKWRTILQGLNATFRHQTVTGKQVEQYISRQSGIDFSKVFAQYLTTTQIPVFSYYIRDHVLHYRWKGVVKGFDMPVKVTLSHDKFSFIHPSETWQTISVQLSTPSRFRVDSSFYVITAREK